MTLAQLAKRISYWQDHPSMRHLDIARWRFRLYWIEDTADDDPDYVVVGHAHPHDFYTDANLGFSKERFEDEHYDHDQDRYIVHELIHVAMRDFDRSITDESPLEDYLPPPVLGLWSKVVLHEREALVDALARTIVSLDLRHREAQEKLRSRPK